MNLLARLFPHRRATEQHARLADAQRMLDERHARDKRERERLYRDLTTARQHLATARQTAPPPPPRTHTPNLIIDRLIIPRLRPRPNDDTKGRL